VSGPGPRLPWGGPGFSPGSPPPPHPRAGGGGGEGGGPINMVLSTLQRGEEREQQ
jgi:hypothetical protein